jgi:hypothetical protein
MLVVVQSKAQKEALGKQSIEKVNILPETLEFYNDGVFKDLLTSTGDISTKVPNVAEPFNLLTYAKKGFNSDLMVDPSVYSSIKDVDFKQLCNAYVVKYPTGVALSPRSPVYITLGYLLAFLNNMCLIYDSVDATLTSSTNPAVPGNPNTLKDSSGHPYFYITLIQQRISA